MFESLGFEALTPLGASVLLGLALGGVYGALAQRSAFCLRRSLVGPWHECLPALGVWVMGLATAIAGTRLAVAAGLISFDAHRFLAPDLPVASALVGGALFGAGMVLAGGCVSRLTVLAGTGNLRALLVLLVFAVTAQRDHEGGARAAPRNARRRDDSRRRGGRAHRPAGERSLATRPCARCGGPFAPLRGTRLPYRDGGRDRAADTPWLDRDGVRPPGRLRPDSASVAGVHRTDGRHPVLDGGGNIDTGRLRDRPRGGGRRREPRRGAHGRRLPLGELRRAAADRALPRPAR